MISVSAKKPGNNHETVGIPLDPLIFIMSQNLTEALGSWWSFSSQKPMGNPGMKSGSLASRRVKMAWRLPLLKVEDHVTMSHYHGEILQGIFFRQRKMDMMV